ncbi:hypothetical protein pb186bvf_015596 [Paramecium bursaria]
MCNFSQIFDLITKQTVLINYSNSCIIIERLVQLQSAFAQMKFQQKYNHTHFYNCYSLYYNNLYQYLDLFIINTYYPNEENLIYKLILNQSQTIQYINDLIKEGNFYAESQTHSQIERTQNKEDLNHQCQQDSNIKIRMKRGHKYQVLKLIVPDILGQEHSRQNYRNTMLIPVEEIFTDLDFANQEIFEVIELYLNYEAQFIKQYTMIEMRDTPNYQDKVTKLVLEYLSNLIFERFEIGILINTEIIEQLCFIVSNAQQPWIIEQVCYTMLQLLIIDDVIIEKFKICKIISPLIENVIKLGFFKNKYFIELVADIITEFSSFDIHKDYGDFLYVVLLWNKVQAIEYGDPLFQIQLEASLCYAIYLLSKDYNDQYWKFIIAQEEFQQFLQKSQERIAKFNNYNSEKSISDAVVGYNSVYLGMIINMIQNIDPIEILNLWNQELEFLLIVDLKSESQEIVDLDCYILQYLISCDVRIRIDLLKSGIYHWFHMILEVGYNDHLNKTQIVNVLLDAINYDDYDYLIEFMDQSLTKALINSISVEISMEQLRDIFNAMAFILNVEQEYVKEKKNQKKQLSLHDSLEVALEDEKNVLLIEKKIQYMQNSEELEELFQNLLASISDNSYKSRKITQ